MPKQAAAKGKAQARKFLYYSICSLILV